MCSGRGIAACSMTGEAGVGRMGEEGSESAGVSRSGMSRMCGLRSGGLGTRVLVRETQVTQRARAACVIVEAQ